jgi:hypothetical protein
MPVAVSELGRFAHAAAALNSPVSVTVSVIALSTLALMEQPPRCSQPLSPYL